jgi:hypothetical protein
MYPEQLQMALLKRKRLVRFGTQELTFVEGPERERLTQSSPSDARTLETGTPTR